MGSIRMVVLGDAATQGTSAKLDVFHPCLKYGTDTVNIVRETQTWSAIAARILIDWVEDEVTMANVGLAGDRSADGWARLEAEAQAQSPDWVLVQYGAEDALQDVGTAAFREHLGGIVEAILAHHARPVLMTPAPTSERMTAAGCTMAQLRVHQERLSALAQVVRDLAREKLLDLIDVNRYFLRNRLAYDHLDRGWLPDGVAQSGMASFVAGELLPLLGVDDFPKPILCDYRKAYSDADKPLTRHNGFTDLTYFEGAFFLAFRTGARHGFRGLLGGKTLVLRSQDGITWTEDAQLSVPGFVETRDPKFLHVGDRLMVYPICHDFCGEEHITRHYGFERMGPGKWSDPFECAPCVLWRPIKWRDGYAAAGYSWKFDSDGDRRFSVGFLESEDGHHWEKTSTILDYGTDGNETELLVHGDTLTAFSRTEGGGNHEMHISTYLPSENRWETVSSGRQIHAPCVFKTGERTMIIGRYCSQSDSRTRELYPDWQKFCNYVQRPEEEGYQTVAEAAGVDPARIEEYHHGLRTGVFVVDGTRPRLVMELLSAGDSSYTGVVAYGDEFVISDYSMHEYYPEIKRPGDWETPSDIYVSRMRFGE
ncbi:MAG: SGNH/GDSL hydrolase family protein [Candidatus Latescibacterota bacterium]